MTARLTPLRAALVALAALAGLFAMHGLTHHGEHLPSHDAAAHHVVGDVMAVVAHPVDAPTADTVPGDHGAMAMCLTILLSGVLAWTLVRRPRSGLLLRIPHPLAAADRPRPASRSHDPPTPWSLSVCRC